MIDLAVRNQELTAELGTRSQQQQALALRDKESYRTQLATQMEQARLQDHQEATAAAERAAATAQRATAAAEQLAAIAAEQAHRAEHPDPTAELHRQEIYEQLQADQAAEAGWGNSGAWNPDLDLPAAPDNNIER